MDLLGSILNSMDKPPAMGEQQKKLIKKQHEALQKRQDEERKKLARIKQLTESKINAFLKNDSEHKLTLEPMDKVSRSIVHEVAEVAGLSAFSFGEEDVDRHIVIYKKEFVPCTEELNAYRRGQTWDPNAKQVPQPTEDVEPGTKEDCASSSKKRKSCTVAPAPYLDKYERLLGKATDVGGAKDAARKTQMNKQYGFVPSENKKDHRSIEQTLADIRAKKKQKVQDESS